LRTDDKNTPEIESLDQFQAMHALFQGDIGLPRKSHDLGFAPVHRMRPWVKSGNPA
jgi:hypothetical protein